MSADNIISAGSDTAVAATVQENAVDNTSRESVPDRARAGWWRAWADQHTRLIATSLAGLIYTTIMLILYWWPIHDRFGTTVIASAGPDTGQNLWYLKWWPYAISHGLNPFITDKMWAPFGYNLTWQTSLAGPSLLVAPITATAGIVVAFNVLLISSFIFTAVAMFVLCYHLVRQFWAALIGGYLFGFSGFMVAQGTGHTQLILLYFIPISIYLYILRQQDRISRLRYLILAPLPLLGLFLTSAEEFALVALFAAAAVGLYWVFSKDDRRTTVNMALETLGAYLIAGIILAPYLYYMVIGYAPGIEHSLETFSGDVLGFVVPTNLFLFFSNHFTRLSLAGGNGSEQDSYLGLPLVVIMVIFSVKYWEKPLGKLLALMALIGVAFTLGPVITLAGVPTIRSPLTYIYKLPFIEKSLPIRYAFFVSLTGAIMAAVWLARDVKRQSYKIVLGVSMAVMLVPNLGAGVFFSSPRVPDFFSTSLYQQYIKPNDVVLILPMGFFGSDMEWQQSTDYYFKLSGGYGGAAPHPDDILPVDYMLYTADATPYLVSANGKTVGNSYVYFLEHYIATRHVNGIVVEERVASQWQQYLSFLDEAPVHAGGVWYYSIPPTFSQATLPGQSVPGDAVARPYNLSVAQWDDTTKALVVPAQTAGTAVETLADQFPHGDYDVSVSLSTTSSDPVARAEIVVDGVTDTQSLSALPNGEAHATVHVANKQGTVLIRIVSLGGASFDVGNIVLTRK